MLKHVDLCSGIGGFALGFKWAGLSKPVLFCDIEPWCRRVLAKNFPDVPIADDVKEIANDPKRFIPEPIGILTAGYPCQPFSAAGKRRGETDPRHIFPHILRIVAQTRPTFTVFENVYGHISMGLDKVLNGMESEGYTVRPLIVPASGVGARHKRDRIWILGYAEHDGPLAAEVARGSFEASETSKEGAEKTSKSEGASRPRNSGAMGTGARAKDVENPSGIECEAGAEEQRVLSSLQENRAKHDNASGRSENVSDPNNSGNTSQGCDADGERTKVIEGRQEQSQLESGRHSDDVPDTESIGVQRYLPSGEQVAYSYEGQEIPLCSSQRPSATQWTVEPCVGRMVNGLPSRMDRIRGLGNAIVPQIAMNIGLSIKGMIENEK